MTSSVSEPAPQCTGTCSRDARSRVPPFTPLFSLRSSMSTRSEPRDHEPTSSRFTFTTTSVATSPPLPSDQGLSARAITRLGVTATQNSRGSDLQRRPFANSTSAQPVASESSDCAFPCSSSPPATTSSSNQRLRLRRALNAPASDSGTRSRSGFRLSKIRSRSGPVLGSSRSAATSPTSCNIALLLVVDARPLGLRPQRFVRALLPPGGRADARLSVFRLARLRRGRLAALAAGGLLLSRVPAAAGAAALPALARAAALPASAGRALRVRDRGRARLAHALLA